MAPYQRSNASLGSGVLNNPIQRIVITHGVVMDQRDGFYMGLLGELDDVIDWAVTPTGFRGILGAGELRIVNEQIRALDELGVLKILSDKFIRPGGQGA